MHDQKLRKWCGVHFSATIKKGLDNYNPAIYHDCCFSFSRRGFSKRWDHPALESRSISKIPSLKVVTTEEQFYSWLREQMQERQKTGKTLVFPTINSPHFSVPDSLDDRLRTPDSSFLRKRCLELSHEKAEVQSEIDRLKEENKRLLSSSKNWFEKYQEAIRSREDSMESTPVKKRMSSTTEDRLFLD